MTQGASLAADSGAVVTADTLNVQGGAKAIAENGGTLDVKDAMNITNGGSASVADGGTLNAKSVQVSGNKSTFVQRGKSNAAVSSLAINQEVPLPLPAVQKLKWIILLSRMHLLTLEMERIS